MDQYCGRILQVSDAATGSGGDLYVQWQWPSIPAKLSA
jgi:hypothetical protein